MTRTVVFLEGGTRAVVVDIIIVEKRERRLIENASSDIESRTSMIAKQ
jgi:hypothetical protein